MCPFNCLTDVPLLLCLQGKGLIISSPSLDSSCLIQCAPLDLSYSSPDYAPLLVAMECLTAPEGELSRRIRGLGLAEGYELTGSPEQGLLTLTLYKAPHLSRAFEEAHAMLQGASWAEHLVARQRGTACWSISPMWASC